MAKKGGSKNDGAWQRSNDFLVTCDPETGSDICDQLEADAAINAAFTAIVSEFTNRNLPLPATMDSLDDWIGSMVGGGFPRDVWMGAVPYDFYDNSTGKYLPILLKPVREAAHAIRKIIRMFVFGRRQGNWLSVDKHPTPTVQALRDAKEARKADPVAWRQAKIDAINNARAGRRGTKPATAPALNRQQNSRKKVLTA